MDERDNPYAPLGFAVVLLVWLILRGSIAMLKE
jgi:hypothetical protein